MGLEPRLPTHHAMAQPSNHRAETALPAGSVAVLKPCVFWEREAGSRIHQLRARGAGLGGTQSDRMEPPAKLACHLRPGAGGW